MTTKLLSKVDKNDKAVKWNDAGAADLSCAN